MSISEKQLNNLELNLMGKPREIMAKTQKPDLLQRAGKIASTVFGGEQIGEFIAAKAGKFLPESLGGVRPQDRPFFSTEGPPRGALVGDIAQTALTLGTLGGIGVGG